MDEFGNLSTMPHYFVARMSASGLGRAKTPAAGASVENLKAVAHYES
jgi:hypothetical protein